MKSLLLVLGMSKASAEKLFLDHDTRISDDTDKLGRAQVLIEDTKRFRKSSK